MITNTHFLFNAPIQQGQHVKLFPTSHQKPNNGWLSALSGTIRNKNILTHILLLHTQIQVSLSLTKLTINCLVKLSWSTLDLNDRWKQNKTFPPAGLVETNLSDVKIFLLSAVFPLTCSSAQWVCTVPLNKSVTEWWARSLQTSSWPILIPTTYPKYLPALITNQVLEFPVYLYIWGSHWDHFYRSNRICIDWIL